MTFLSLHYHYFPIDIDHHKPAQEPSTVDDLWRSAMDVLLAHHVNESNRFLHVIFFIYNIYRRGFPFLPLWLWRACSHQWLSTMVVRFLLYDNHRSFVFKRLTMIIIKTHGLKYKKMYVDVCVSFRQGFDCN